MRRLTILTLVMMLCGCVSYQFGTRTLYRPDITTVYVPIFESESLRRNLAERLTEAVQKEIERKTPYRVVSTPAADSALRVRILEESKRVLIENANDEPRAIEIGMQVEVSWLDGRGALIGGGGGLPLAPVLVAESGATLIPEAGQSVTTAQQQAIQRLAEQIVTQMEIPW